MALDYLSIPGEFLLGRRITWVVVNLRTATSTAVSGSSLRAGNFFTSRAIDSRHFLSVLISALVRGLSMISYSWRIC